MTNYTKNQRQTVNTLRAAVLAAATLCSSGTVMAQMAYTNVLAQGFDTIDTVPSGLGGNMASSAILDWSTDGNPGGAIWAQIPWANTSGGWQELQINYDFPWPGAILAPYATIEYDVKALAPADAGTDNFYGTVQLVFQGWANAGANGSSGLGWSPLGLVSITNVGVWQHVVHKITAYEQFSANRAVINFVGQRVTNSITYLIDNLELKAPNIAPMKINLATLPPGGGLHALTAGAIYDRQSIRTAGTNFSFAGASSPVTYSFTIGKYPATNDYPDYQAHIILAAGPTSGADVDWGTANIIRLDVGNEGGTLRFKTNSPSNNGGLYTPVAEGGGEYPTVTSSTLLGKWSVTFNNNTSVTVTAPDGASSNFVFSAAGSFDTNNFRVYFGAQANEAANIGQEVVFTEVAINGVGGSPSDNFSSGTIDAAKWQKSAAQANNVFVLAPNVRYGLSWPIPDNLFKLRSGATLTGMTNSDLTGVLSSLTRTFYVPDGYPSAASGFFDLVKRNYKKLQVLMPGETAVPGTETGKTGTPLHQKAGVPFKVTVNAVDEKWNRAYADPEIWLESQPGGDGSAFMWENNQANLLIQGTWAYTFTNTTAGTFKIHVLDNRDQVTSADGSDYVVDP